MTEPVDIVALYAQSRGMSIGRRTVLVEGDTDVRLFRLASRLESAATGRDLINDDIAIASAGFGEDGGCRGVIRELVTLRRLARVYLQPNGKPVYRFIGILDNDKAGREALRSGRNFDTSLLEYRDVFMLHPLMPNKGSLDLKTLATSFEKANAQFSNLDWELEDYLPSEFLELFDSEFPTAVLRSKDVGAGRVHRDYTGDGKVQLHQFISNYASRHDLAPITQLTTALRFYCGLQNANTSSP